MIDFIRKYILFPSRFGFQPYLWLMWLIIPIVQLFPYQNLKQQLALLVLIVFAWFYRNSWTVTPFINVWLVGQYIIILFLIICKRDAENDYLAFQCLHFIVIDTVNSLIFAKSLV